MTECSDQVFSAGLQLFELIPDQSGKRLSVILITSCHNNIFVVGLQGGHIMLFDDTDLKLVGKFCIVS